MVELDRRSVFHAATVFPWFSGVEEIVPQVAVRSPLKGKDATEHGLFAEIRLPPGIYTKNDP